MKKVIMLILDGCGIRQETYGNAFLNANTPTIDSLMNKYPNSTLYASEEHVGLPKGQMGNSEVGHMNIGAGRIMHQELSKINKALEDKSFYKNEEFINAINNCKKNDSNLHLIGILSDGAVHGHIDHLLALLELCKQQNFTRVYIHAILDGRDTTPMEGPKHIKRLQEKMNELKIGEIITIEGRYYLMNRDRNWKLTQLAYNAVVNGESIINVNNTEEAFEKQYEENLTDEFMKPTVIKKLPITSKDSIISYNFRSDRLIQFCRAILNPEFKEFTREKINPYLVIMTEYENEPYYKDVKVAFKKDFPKNTLGEIISNNNLKQLRLSEYEKRLHVTFYFSGCRLKPYKLQKDILLQRPNVFTYDEMPEMRAYDITDELIKSTKEEYALTIVNFPNGDSLGHTGFYKKAIEGVEHVDKCLKKIIENINLDEYTLIITSDHGNCEHMIEEDGEPDKKHTTAKVPFIICNKNYKVKNGKLADIAPTILKIMDLNIPEEMTGEVLI